MGALILLAQIVISLIVTALSMPALLVTFPVLRDRPAGLAAVAGILLVTFAGIRIVWPKRKA